MAQDNAIIVFARHPTPGQVKTRLAVGVGNDGAARLYKQCAEKVIQECLNTDAATYIFFSVPEEEQQVRTWLAPLDQHQTLQFMPQLQSPDLGARLADAMLKTFIIGNHRRVAVIGTDVPDLESTHFNTAFEALEKCDTVFGPAEDGGYYLCALGDKYLEEMQKEKTSPAASLFLRNFFSGINWSTETVLKQSIDNSVSLGLKTAPLGTLPTLWDIDTIQDLREWSKITTSMPRSGETAAAAAVAVRGVALEILSQAEVSEEAQEKT